MIDRYKSFASEYKDYIDLFINSFFQKKIQAAELPFMRDLYADLLEYSIRDGKRIRPLNLLIGFYGYKRLWNRSRDIIALASVLELMHCFLLVQDDIIDNSILRRGEKALHVKIQDLYGKQSLNKNLGADIAIVLADILFTSSIEIISTSRVPGKVKNRFLSLFAVTYEMTAWGQVLDSMNSMSKKIDILGETPLHISKMKTAYYTIYKPLLMGYALTGRDDNLEQAVIEQFSMSLGLAFQLRDDILGVFGHEGSIGKSSDSDIYEGKTTLLINNTMNMLNKKQQKEFLSFFMTHPKKKKHVTYIKDVIRKSGALEQVQQKHKDLIKDAFVKLEKLSIRSEYRDILSGEVEAVSVIGI